MHQKHIHTHFVIFLELSEKLNVELSELRVTYYQLKEEHQQLQDKIKFYDKVSALYKSSLLHLCPSLSLSPSPSPSHSL